MKPASRVRLTALVLTLGYASTALAGSMDVVIENAWSRASIGTDRPGVAYMKILNAGDEPITLMGLRTDLAKMPEIHQTSTSADGISSMASASDISIPPGESAVLEPGGLHVMLMQLLRPMQEGVTFPLTLVFSDGGEVTIDVPILGIAARGPQD